MKHTYTHKNGNIHPFNTALAKNKKACKAKTCC